MFYRSERLFLRPAFPEDSRELYEGICDAGVIAMLASAPWPYRPADAEQYCAMMDGRWVERGWGRRDARSGAPA